MLVIGKAVMRAIQLMYFKVATRRHLLSVFIFNDRCAAKASRHLTAQTWFQSRNRRADGRKSNAQGFVLRHSLFHPSSRGTRSTGRE